jgi:hypothetical protein
MGHLGSLGAVFRIGGLTCGVHAGMGVLGRVLTGFAVKISGKMQGIPSRVDRAFLRVRRHWLAMKFFVQLVLVFLAALAIGYVLLNLLLNLWDVMGLAGPVQRALRAMVMVRQ